MTRRSLGSGAGVLAASLLAFIGVGALWGLLRPTYEGRLVGGGQVAIEPAFNVEFTSYIPFAAATGLLAAVVALCVYTASPASRGPGMLWWLIVVAAVSTFAFWQVGLVTSSLLHPLPEPDSLDEGAFVEFAPGFRPGVALVAAPLMAALSYWCAALVTPEERELSAPIQ